MNNQKLKLITHNGSFHTDDIFACATLSLMLEKENKDFEIIRTRDEEIIKTGDYVFDVGGIYDAEKNRFDHHQRGGAGKRLVLSKAEGENGIEYSSLGLIWKKFGEKLCDDSKIASMVDQRLVAPIDAGDNGINLVEMNNKISPYFIQSMFGAMLPTWKEKDLNKDEIFLKCVEIAKNILTREIIQARDVVMAESSIKDIYASTEDERLILMDKSYPTDYISENLLKVLFAVSPKSDDDTWAVKAIRKNKKTFENRKDLPATWAGLRDAELQKVTGVADAVFCHRGLFLAVAQSKEGAIKLAQIALES